MLVKPENAKALMVLTEGEFNYIHVIVVKDLTANVFCGVAPQYLDRFGDKDVVYDGRRWSNEMLADG